MLKLWHWKKKQTETSLGIAIFWAWVYLCTKISGKLFACMTDKNQFFGRGQIERDKERLVSGTHFNSSIHYSISLELHEVECVPRSSVNVITLLVMKDIKINK